MSLLSWEDYRLKNRKAASSDCTAFAETDEKFSGIQKLNKATESDLMAIEGVGPKKAKVILENGPFESFDSLTALNGVSKKICESIKSWAILTLQQESNQYNPSVETS